MHIVEFKGGLGNQLFELCFYFKLVEKYKKDVYAYIGFYKNNHDHEGFICGNFFNIQIIDKLPKIYQKINENNFNKSDYLENINYLYTGYWQSEKYFPNDISFLNNIFSAKVLNKSALQILKSIKSNKTSVSIHVRRGDYINNFIYDNIANAQYFNNCIKYVLKKYSNAKFYIFSDDIEWCKNNLNLKNNIVYVPTHKSWMDIYLMSLCKINVISNSTFSWWAKTINCSKDKVSLAPKYWFNVPLLVKPLNTSDSILIDNFKYYLSHIANAELTFVLLINDENLYQIRGTIISIMNQINHNVSIIVYINKHNKNVNYIYALSKKDKRIIIILKRFYFRHPKINMQLISSKFIIVTPDYFLKNDLCSSLSKGYNSCYLISDSHFTFIGNKKNEIYNKCFNKKSLPNVKKISIKTLKKYSKMCID